MLDIIFISYDEPNANKNFNRLASRFPHARRVHGVKGIAEAHFAAAKKAMTKFFYVVDADAVINPYFDFSFKPVGDEEKYVHIWKAENPIGITYGYGGVKLFAKSFFREQKSYIDFTTSLTKDVKYHEEVSNITEFNSDKYRAFRGAFREAAKLAFKLIHDHKMSVDESAEAAARLNYWQYPAGDIAFVKYIHEGANAGIEFAEGADDISFINEHELIEQELQYRFPPEEEVALDKRDVGFQFVTRIASILYDSTVVSTLPITELRDAISDGQIYSKKWLVAELARHLKDKHVAILGGWIGTLALMMKVYDVNAKITSVDTDRRANRIAEKLNYDMNGFSTLTEDMYKLDYSQFDVIINTSSEHIPNIQEWRASIPPGKIVAVQNNNFFEGGGHISCVQSSEELKAKLNLSEVLYEGTKKFPQYDRYMVIGRT